MTSISFDYTDIFYLTLPNINILHLVSTQYTGISNLFADKVSCHFRNEVFISKVGKDEILAHSKYLTPPTSLNKVHERKLKKGNMK